MTFPKVAAWSLIAMYLLLAALGISKLKTTGDNRVFFSDSDDEFSKLLQFENDFSSYTSLIYVIESSSANGFNTELLEFLTEAAWSLPKVTRVVSIANYPNPVDDKNGLRLENVLDSLCSSNTYCSPRSLNEIDKSYLEGLLISNDRRTVAVIVSLALFEKNEANIGEIYSKAVELQDRAQLFGSESRVYLTGGLPMMQAFVDSANADSTNLIPIALLVLVALLFIFLGTLRLSLAVLATGLFGILGTLGVAGWTGHVINSATSTAPLVVLTLSIAAAMHVFVAISRDTRRVNFETKYREARDTNLEPILLATLTTGVSLLSLCFVPSPPIQQLGYLCAFGLTSAVVALLVLFPTVSSQSLTSAQPNVAYLSQNSVRRIAITLYERGISKALVLLIFAVSLCGLAFVEVDDDFVKYFPESSKFRLDTEAADRLLIGPYGIEVVMSTGEPGGVFDPAFLESVDRVTRRLRAMDRVEAAYSIYDVVSDAARAVGQHDIRTADANQNAAAFLVYELSLGEGQNVTDLANLERSAARVSVVLAESSSREIRAFIENEIRHVLSEEPYEFYVTGEIVPTAYLPPKNIRAMLLGILASISFTALLLGMRYKSITIAGIAILSIAAPVAAGFGLWGWVSGPIGLATSAIVAIAIGIVIDDSIHFVYRYRELESAGASDETIIESVFLRSGIPIAATSILLACGFATMIFSQFEMNSAFGISTATIVLLALLFDTALLPGLLLASSRMRSRGPYTGA